MLREKTDELLQTLRDPRTGERTIKRAANAWMKALQNPPSLPAILEAQTQLCGALEWENIERAQLALVIGGSLVEQGFAPEPLIEAYAPVLPVWLENANQLLQSALVNGELDEATFERSAAQSPAWARAWQQLESLYFPLIAALSVSPSGRESLRPLLPQIAPLTSYLESAYYLSMLLQVLDNAPILIIEPALQRGFVGTMSGVADCFQLHALLMAHFPDTRAPVSDAATSVHRGHGAQITDENLMGIWNLYNYRALNPDGDLPTDLSDSSHWIWNEDLPAEIPEFAGYRVVLLGPASYERAWKVQRAFAALRAEIVVERELNETEIADWLGRMSESE